MPGATAPSMSFALQEAVAADAARQAASVVLTEFARTERPTGPVATRPTAAVDKAADEVLARVLLGAFPEYGWLCEESGGRTSGDRARRWVVDPLDGTREFVLGIPEFAVSVALTDGNELVVAALLNPIEGRLYRASLNSGTWRDAERMTVSATASLAGASVLASRSEVERGEWGSMRGSMRVRAMGSVAYKMARVASGQDDATFTLVPKHTWDVAAGILLVREAGGIVTLPDGGDIPLNAPGNLLPGLVASNGIIHDELLATIALKSAPETALQRPGFAAS
jgi:myo-inositol-1(or 4)-monophosphatase